MNKHRSNLIIAMQLCTILLLTIFAGRAQSQTLARSDDSYSNYANGSLTARPEFRFLAPPTQASNPFARRSPTAASLNLTAATMVSFPNITGSGTPGKIPYFSAGAVIRDSIITQSKAGNIGIGTATPGSKLSVEGVIESLSGGFKFPDGSVQATAGIAPNQVVRSLNTLKGDLNLVEGANITITPGANTLTIGATGLLGSVAHNATLIGDGTAGMPLGVGVPLILSGNVASSGAVISAKNTGSGAGVVGLSPGGTGVEGVSDSFTGVFGQSTSYFGVTGFSNSLAGVVGNSNTGAGVVGISDSGPAGVFLGDVDVSGTLSKGGGSFKIDHPLNPENKYLYHSFVESPDMMNVYNGNITTDLNGEAIVILPEYFQALNTDFRYQLTVIGQFAQAIVAEKIHDNRFTIKTDNPNVEVSWQVTGIRRDRWAEKNRFPVVEDKPERERGYFLHPEVHNQPEERGVEWARNPEMIQQMKETRLKQNEEAKQQARNNDR